LTNRPKRSTRISQSYCLYRSSIILRQEPGLPEPDSDGATLFPAQTFDPGCPGAVWRAQRNAKAPMALFLKFSSPFFKRRCPMHQKAVTVQQRHETGRTAGPLSARSSGVPKAASASFTVHHRFNDVAVYPQDTKDSLCPLPAPRSCPFGGACHACPIRIHASLKAGRSESSGEREARRIADDVMNRSDAFEKMPLDGGQQNRPQIGRASCRERV
jgi:hypothetical protein